jgi:hypothetical protein
MEQGTSGGEMPGGVPLLTPLPLDEVEPCPGPAQVRLWDPEGSGRVACRSRVVRRGALVAIEEDP